MDCLAFQGHKVDALYQDCADASMALYDSLPEKFRNACKIQRLLLKMFNNWETGAHKSLLRAKIVICESVLNGEGTWEDILPNALFPNATTAEEIFAENFPAEERAKGRDEILFPGLEEMASSPLPSLVYLDYSQTILKRITTASSSLPVTYWKPTAASNECLRYILIKKSLSLWMRPK